MSVASPMPSACTPIRLRSGSRSDPGRPNHQRASYSRNPVTLISALVSKPKLFGLASPTILNALAGTPDRKKILFGFAVCR